MSIGAAVFAMGFVIFCFSVGQYAAVLIGDWRFDRKMRRMDEEDAA